MRLIRFWRRLWAMDKFLALLLATMTSMMVFFIGSIVYEVRQEAIEYKANAVKAVSFLQEYGNTARIARVRVEKRRELSGKTMQDHFYVVTFALFHDGHEMVIENRDTWFNHALIPREGEHWRVGIYRYGSRAVINLAQRVR